MMRMRNVDDSIATPPSPSVSLPSLLHPSQLRSVLHSLWIKLVNPDNFAGIHWALSFFKSGRAATFAECIVRQEMRTGVIAFADWTDFTSEFMSTFCPENEATSALMCLKSDHYFQGQRNVDTYIDEFRDLVDMSSYTDPIAIVLKFR
jgi:hypothetical protein